MARGGGYGLREANGLRTRPAGRHGWTDVGPAVWLLAVGAYTLLQCPVGRCAEERWDQYPLGQCRYVRGAHAYYPKWLPRGYDTVSAAVGDIDGDGGNELLLATNIGYVDVLKWQQTRFVAVATDVPLHRANWSSFVLGDLDSCGAHELVLGTPYGRDGSLIIFKWRDGGFAKLLEPQVDERGAQTPLEDVCCIADVDGNGRPDLIGTETNYVDREEWLRRYEWSDGCLALKPGHAFLTLGQSTVIAGDLIGTGRPQLLCGTPEYYSPPHDWWEHPHFQVFGWDAAAGDFTRLEDARIVPDALLCPLACVQWEAKPVVIGRSGHFAHLVEREGTGFRASMGMAPPDPDVLRSEDWPPPSSPGVPVTVGDLDNNGSPDLVLVAGDGEFRVWLDILGHRAV